jgi:acylphosphatase
MKTMKVLYEGRVQGVGFRWTTRRIAQGYDVTGQVRNLPDGRVELYASGEPEEVVHFLKDIRESALAGHITAEQADDVAVPASFKGFHIVA